MSAHFCNLAFFDYADYVRVLDGGQSMGDCYAGSTLSCIVQSLLDDLEEYSSKILTVKTVEAPFRFRCPKQKSLRPEEGFLDRAIRPSLSLCVASGPLILACLCFLALFRIPEIPINERNLSTRVLTTRGRLVTKLCTLADLAASIISFKSTFRSLIP